MRRSLLTTALALLVAAGCNNEQLPPAGSGMIEATEITVSAQTSGEVSKLFFDEGTFVNAGDTLLIIDPSKLNLELASAHAGRDVAMARLETARVQLREAREAADYQSTELARVEKLVAANTATQRQLDEVRYRHTQAETAVSGARAAIATTEAEIARIDADIARLQRLLADAYPIAPTSGTVTEKYVDAGELLSPGRPIARLARMDSVWVKIYLSAADFANVSLGKNAKVDTEAGTAVEGTVTWMADQAEFTPKNVQTKNARADLVYAVEVTLANPQGQLKIGQPVYVTVAK